uniref:Transient receptor potential channel 6, subfamily V n=1 Tax=Callorhinchus milii TaxID=7868 RepID=V9KEJ8_CALMI
MTSLMASSLRRLRAVWPETGTETGTPGVGQQVQELHVLQQKRISESPLLYAAKENMVQDIKKLIRCPSIDNFQTGTMGETALHIASTYGNYQAVVTLLEAVPELVNLPITGELYQGETSLHIAVANGNVTLVRELIRRGADVVTPRATGTFFRLGGTGILYYGEHVLSFAACVGNEGIVRILIENGADIKAQDSLGNTVLHHLVLQTQTKVTEMFDLILSLEPKDGATVETMTNQAGLTPFKLAAQEGNVQLFQHLLRKRERRLQWFFQSVSTTFYDISGIDSWDDNCSVLDLVVFSKEIEALKILDLHPIKELVSFKWNRYGKYYFRCLSVLYLLYIIIFTLCCTFRPLIPRPEVVTDPEDTQLLVEAPLKLCYVSTKDQVRLVGELISVFGAIAILFIEISDMVRYGVSGYFGKTVYGGPFHAINICYACLVLLILVLRLSSAGSEGIFMSLAMVLAWCNFIHFARGFQTLGTFSILIHKIVLENLMPYLFLMLIIIVGFTTGLYVIFQELDPKKWVYFDGFKNEMFLMFMLFFGLLDIPLNYEVYTPYMIKVLYVAYIMMTFQMMAILLINLIAGTLRRVVPNRNRIYRAQVIASTLHLERRLPRLLWPRAGTWGEKVGLDNSWYIWVEDRNDKPAPSNSRDLTTGESRAAGDWTRTGRAVQPQADGRKRGLSPGTRPHGPRHRPTNHKSPGHHVH